MEGLNPWPKVEESLALLTETARCPLNYFLNFLNFILNQITFLPKLSTKKWMPNFLGFGEEDWNSVFSWLSLRAVKGKGLLGWGRGTNRGCGVLLPTSVGCQNKPFYKRSLLCGLSAKCARLSAYAYSMHLGSWNCTHTHGSFPWRGHGLPWG